MGVNRVNYGGDTLIDLTQDTVTAASLLAGFTAHGADGEAITGTASASGAHIGETTKSLSSNATSIAFTGLSAQPKAFMLNVSQFYHKLYFDLCECNRHVDTPVRSLVLVLQRYEKEYTLANNRTCFFIMP